MARPILFGNTSSSQSQNKNLVEFRAGKMAMKSKIVSADKRKGLLYVYQSDDSLMHFCWKDRTTGVVEDDLIIFPDDVVFKKVPECVDGRVFVLKFKSSSRRCFYWLQEPKCERDNEYCCKINQILNNPPSGRGGASSSSTSQVGSGGGGGGGGASGLQSELSSLGDSDLQNLLNNMSQQQLIQLLGGMPSLSSILGSSSRPSSQQSTSGESTTSHSVETTQPSRVVSSTSQPTTTTTTTTTAAASAATTTTTVTSTSSATASSGSSLSIQLSDLQNILSGLSVPPAPAERPQRSVDLTSAINVETLKPLFGNKQLMDRIRDLLPSSTDSSPLSTDLLRSTVQSPQFQQALGMFSAALQSGQLGPLMQQFGMAPEVVTAANSGDLDTFVKALQNSKKDDKDKDDKEEDMALD